MSVPDATRLRTLQRLLAGVAILFGAATLLAGARVLAGADPGYAVYRPLLVFNTAMGAAYLAAGVLAWRDLRRGVWASGAVALANALVLLLVGWLFTSGDAVASESVGAMAFRTTVWVVLWGGLAMLWRRAGRGALRSA